MSPGNELSCMSLRVAGEKKGKITGKKFGKGDKFALSLHPLSRERARGEGGRTRGSGKKSLKKKLEKVWRVKKNPYLCSRFRARDARGRRERGREVEKKEFFKILR